MTNYENTLWKCRLIYFQENKTWSLLEFLQWSIVYAKDFNEKQDEHLLYKICLEKLSINPQLIETNDSNESIIIKQLALQYSLDASREVSCYSSVINAESTRMSLNSRGMSPLRDASLCSERIEIVQRKSFLEK
ncbi:777_t:CDS:2 [Funneliformis geosporum]|uniref:777_t:CDS:1 n=1 Tax=Funneliformis geosporum TaxID=1117311 RepID=A0A9W4X2F6_9GLOM|nr:777_t:CDS:2 [Funneliformis geosporum]